MVELLVCHYLVVTYTPCTFDVRLDACILLATASTMHYIYDMMLGQGLVVSG